MRSNFARVYRSFEEFEQEELRKLDQLSDSIDDMLGDLYVDELKRDESSQSRPREIE
jgi:hypothetical protein